MQAIFETIFDIVYLFGVVTLGVKMIKGSNGRKQYFLYGIMAVVLGFYIPVVLFADAIPLIGMLMIPKTCAYVWMVLIGYNAMKGELKK